MAFAISLQHRALQSTGLQSTIRERWVLCIETCIHPRMHAPSGNTQECTPTGAHAIVCAHALAHTSVCVRAFGAACVVRGRCANAEDTAPDSGCTRHLLRGHKRVGTMRQHVGLGGGFQARARHSRRVSCRRRPPIACPVLATSVSGAVEAATTLEAGGAEAATAGSVGQLLRDLQKPASVWLPSQSVEYSRRRVRLGAPRPSLCLDCPVKDGQESSRGPGREIMGGGHCWPYWI